MAAKIFQICSSFQFNFLFTGGVGSNQIQSHKRSDGVTEMIYRKTLSPTNDAHDNEIYEDKVTY